MASAYLSQNLPANQNSLHKWTYSGWIKRCSLGVETYMFNFFDDDNNRGGFRFNADDTLLYYERVGGSTVINKTTNRVFRDTSAWYHIMVAVDKSVSSPNTQIYINGVEETSFSTNTDYSQNQTTKINDTDTLYINSYNGSGDIRDQLQTHIHWVSGYKLTPTSFGETDSTSGIWKPKTSPSVTYGTNGYFLKFENSGAMGTDSSGNGNNFTVSGTITQTEDTPSNNFATLNPLQSNLSLTNGNLQATTTNYKYGVSTLAVSSGKWYVEMKVTDPCMVMGIQDMIKANDGLRNTAIFWSSGSESYHLDGFSKFTHDSYGDISSNASDYPTYANGDIIGMAIDLDNNKLQYSKNGTWYKSADPANGTNMETIDASSTLTSGNYGIVVADACGASDGTFYMNFGNGYFGTTAVSSSNSDSAGLGLFEYSVPSGYYALCTKNIKNYG